MKKYTYTDKIDTRSGFGAGLEELGKTNPNVIALCADLTGSLKMDAFKNNHPERFFQVGIAEANMMGMAAGMTIGGKIPFTGTFANFSTGRVYDQIRQCQNMRISRRCDFGRRWSYPPDTRRHRIDENVTRDDRHQYL